MTRHDNVPSRNPLSITREDVLAATPESYRPYVEAMHAISDTEPVELPWCEHRTSRVTARGTWAAIRALSEADKAGTLQPPLPQEIGRIIHSMSDRADTAMLEQVSRNETASTAIDSAARTYSNVEYREAAALAVRSALANAGIVAHA